MAGHPGDIVGNLAKGVRDAGERVRVDVWSTRLARLGLAAKGVVYVLVGVIAYQVARGERGQARDAKGSLLAVAGENWGSVLLAVIGVSLFGYVLWRFIQAIKDPEREGHGPKALAKRAGYLFSGLIYFGMALFSLRLAAGQPQADGNGAQTWAARLLSMPLGEWWAYMVGLGLIAYGVKELYKAWKADFSKEMPPGSIDPSRREAAVRFGRAGLASRGVVLGLMGAFFLKAANNSDPSQAQGIDGALNALARQNHGTWFLTLAATGLVAYGVFQIIEARYRRIVT